MSDERRRRALALARQADAASARVVAKGYGDVAEQIIARAREHGVHVHDAPELVDLLMGLDLDARIPARFYDVIAELLAWLDAAEQSLADDGDAPG